MKYAGRFPFFEFDGIQTTPIAGRSNKVLSDDLLDPLTVCRQSEGTVSDELQKVVDAVIEAVRRQRPVMVMMGAHPVKLGLSRLLIDLIDRGVITHIAGNGAVSIHDFELALIGETSENVPNALPEGSFGMAYETGAFMNRALTWGNEHRLGYGEAIARMILGEDIGLPVDCHYPELSLLAAAYRKGIPMTIHATHGTDIIDQHPSSDGEAKGGCVGRDFGVFAASITQYCDGGVILNIGSAVTMPEVLLKSVSMAANVGRVPQGLLCGDFDLRPDATKQSADESAVGYYWRDQKSVVTRIPQAFAGQGVYVQGDFRQTVPLLYRTLIKGLDR